MVIHCSADGEILVEMICVFCSSPLQWLTTGARLIHRAFLNDLEEAQAKNDPRPLKPPLKLLPPPDVKLGDDNFLRDCGVEGI